MMITLVAEEDGVGRSAACGSGVGGVGGGEEYFEPSFLWALSDGGDVWGAPLEPSALGGLPILVFCILGLVSLIWTAFGAATFGRVNSSKRNTIYVSKARVDGSTQAAGDARAGPPPHGGERTVSVLLARRRRGERAIITPPKAGVAEAPPQASRARNGKTDSDGNDDDGDGRLAEVSSCAMLGPGADPGGGGGAQGLKEVNSEINGGSGGVGLFFNGREWRRKGFGEEKDGGAPGDVDMFGGVETFGGVGADRGGRQPGRYYPVANNDDGADGASNLGESEWGAGSCEGIEDEERCRPDSSVASSSVADVRLLEADDRDAEIASRWEHTPAVNEQLHGGAVPSAGDTASRESSLEQHAAEINSVECQFPAESSENSGETKRSAAEDTDEQENGERRLLSTIKALLLELEQDLDAARVLLPECHRFRKVVGCVAEGVGPGMDASPRQAMDVIEALREATEFSRTLSSPEAFLVVMAELLVDGSEDPPAMLSHCTRRLSRAVSALPEPSPSFRASVTAARSQLRSLAKGPGASGRGVGVAGPTGPSLSSSSTLAAAAAATTAAVAITAVAAFPEPPTSASSSSTATMAVTPLSMSAGPSQGPSSLFPPSQSTSVWGAVTVAGGGCRREGEHAAASDQRRGRSGDRQRVEDEHGEQACETLPAEGAAAVAATSAGGAAAADSVPEGSGSDAVVDDVGGDGAGGGASSDGSENKSAAGLEVTSPPSHMGPALTSEAAGLSELIRRRGGLSALSDARTVAVVLRAAAPRRQSAFHLQAQQRHARSFFESEAEDGGVGGSGAGAPPVLSTPPRRGAEGGEETLPLSRPSGGDDEGGGRKTGVTDGGNSTYVSTSCGGFFGSTKSPVVDSQPSLAALPWPSPQDASVVCQKLAKRVEARIEAMVPFALPNPTPASERRRVRNANSLLFSITAGRRGAFPIVAGGRGGGRIFDVVSNRCGSGGERCRRPRLTNLEEQLYAGFGALLEAAKMLLPGAKEGGAAVNAVGETAVLTLKGACALDRAPSVRDTSLTTVPRRTSMCQHAVCAPRFGRKTLDGGARYEDGVLLVPDCRKLRQEIVRSTCMDPAGSIRPDFVAYAGAPIFIDGAPLGTFCVFSRRTLKDLGWGAHHTIILRGLADAAATEMTRLCRVAELEDQQEQINLHRGESASSTSRGGGRGGGPVRVSTGRSSRSSSASRRSGSASSCDTTAAAAAAAAAPPRALSFAERSNSFPTPSTGGTLPRSASGPPAGSGDACGATVGEMSASGAAVGVRGTTSGAASDHLVPWGTPIDGRDGVLFLAGLGGRAASSSPPRGGPRGGQRSMSEAGVRAGYRPPPLLSTRSSAESGGEQATVVAAAASSESQWGSGTKKRWHRALRKLRIRPRGKSAGGGSDEGDNGSSSSLEVSLHRTAGGSTDPQEIFRERSRAW